MKDFLSQLHFAKPLFFLLLLLLPLLWLRLRERPFTVIFWRSVIFLLLVLALTDPEQVGEVTKKGERIFAFDLSRSISTGMRLWMARPGFAPQPSDRTFVFGSEVKEVTDWDRWVRGEVSSSPIKPEQTNLETLFSTLLRLPAAPRTVFLFTDGWETQGAVERLLPSLALSGMRVFPLLPPDRPEVANVAVKRVLAPHQGTSGEGINVKVVVENHNAREVDGSITLTRNGQPFKDEAIKIKPGSHIFTYQTALPEGPLSSFQASFVSRRPELDRFSQDNQATTWVSVRVKEKVLLFNGRSGEGRYLEEILKRRGFEVTSATLNASPPSPAGYGVVVFNDVEREKFSPAYLAALEQHVAAGNAFLMLGGEGSFGPGGYRQTPIETLLPVELKEPKKEEKNRAVVLVIDKSGSMREEDRLLYAKEAAKAAVSQLKDRDLLGVVGFDVEPFVVVPLGSVEKIRATLATQIERLKAGGQTYLYPAIVEAKRQLEKQSATRKHVIVLSDGETRGSHGELIDLVSLMKDELKITVSALAIGGEADIRVMKRIAQYGGGFFHHTYDPKTLPQIVLQQMQEKPEEKPPVERDFIPVPVRGSELLAGFPESSFPPLKGYMETEIKRGARQDLVIPREAGRSPLLASWNYGKGKAVAFTTDLRGHWSKEWIQWEALERFWGKVFEWLRPPKEPFPPHEVRINLRGDHPVLDLYLYGEENDGSLFRYTFSGKGSTGEGLLKRLAPGRYQTTLPFSAPGDYRIGLIEEGHGQRLSYPPLGYTLAFDPRSEIPQDDFNIPLLEQLARYTGGKINPSGEEKLGALEVIRIASPLRSYLIFLALTLFLLEIIFRRFFPCNTS
ncbi:MAG: VWA domain-containing protein [Deltaproteobacteria bacterium]|nr:VWA domain-containing protein [Deltaproteobacteria bacterium]